MEHQHSTYNEALIIISCIIAVVASYSALDLAGRISTTKGKVRSLWLICGAVSMGLGIWSMHFVGMLALSLPMDIYYDMNLVFLSVVSAISVSCISLYIVSRNELGPKQMLIGGALMATGISAMHYIGMAAMNVDITYSFGWVVLSIVIAVVASIAALWLLFYFRKDQSRFTVFYKLGSGLVMGAAISGMHYTGMAAAHFHQAKQSMLSSGMRIEPEVLAYLIIAGTFIMLGMTLFGVFINKRLTQKDSAIQEHERWYTSLYNNNSDGIISVDIEGKIIGFNPAVFRITGFKEDQFQNKHISSFDMYMSEDIQEEKQVYKMDADQNQSPHETTLIRKDGSLVELYIINVPVEIEEKVVGNHIIIKDITKEKHSRERIQYQAFHDELTGLPNRRMFNQMLAQSIDTRHDRPFKFAVMVLDIDRFKMINDSLGHTYGDLFLQMVSSRISKAAEQFDVTLARMGGDEFTVICNNCDNEAEASLLAERIVREIQLPYRLKDNDYFVSASIGIAFYPEHGTDAVQLLKNADTAMYEVKKNGKNGFQFFTPELNAQLHEKIELEGELRKAIERSELLLHYQPQIRTGDSLMVGVEALVRWNHPAKGLLAPGVFIPIAEETGMIYDIGTWVLREACRQMREWHRGGGPLIPVSVNLSAQQFHQPNLVGYIRNILEDTGLDPQYLELEITESMMMDAAVSAEILNELSQFGIRISLDDFGTGYSSLGYLKLLPIDKLKIDRSFITDITMNESDKAIVSTIIAMAHHLKMDVIAEGIETKDQLDILTANKCEEIQGYYFSRPLSATDVEAAFFAPMRINISGDDPKL
ncbi:bifunctional diguanylate cyclase/phosphodiesterase [Paenibacillus eucommiae]|uniref:Diguanylate cyclase (GGDEF)-like protein/PAS domain S-box-containing protein n=1 Tax=Paenibacillus eucommiae TaxID=1355755 RepID=A0ABS4J253_9BACL|nr:bifunctional diguanylate cyclase/phosphodiesterase [Paenibacillus eucommiae]MBP1993905.1 diguanylate cyclase (GGDEF)-like protein/PAS domain S-box-containing protein [Paenibacillus eucommiae]